MVGVENDGGFDKKTAPELSEDQRQALQSELGSDVELRPNSPLRKMVEVISGELGRLWNATEDVYFASAYEDARGQQLDKLLALAGYQRRRLLPATGEVEFSRSTPAPDDITIPAGTVVTTQRTQTRPRIPFETTQDVLLQQGDSSVTAPIEALKPWQTSLDDQWLGAHTNVAANTIVRFDSPVSGVDSVTNPDPTGDTTQGYQEGRDRETDAEFKLRYESTLASEGTATVEAIRASVLDMDEIISASVEENTTINDNTGSGGLPPKSFRVTVLEDATVPDDDIAQTILDNRPAGIESYGSEQGTGTLEGGYSSTEYFERASQVDIQADITVTTTDSYPSDGDTQMEDRIIRYIGGTSSTGLEYGGLGIGENVVYDQVFKRVIEGVGIQEADLQIAEVGNTLGSSNISIGNLEAALIASGDITITHA